LGGLLSGAKQPKQPGPRDDAGAQATQ
jgi:hypothetical protein